MSKQIKFNDKAIEKAIMKSLNNVADKIITQSQNEVPVDTGALKRSIEKEEIKTNNTYTIKVSYSTDYALKQHNTSWFNHNIGKAYYLSDPTKKNIPLMKVNLASEIRGILRNGNILSSKITDKGIEGWK